MVMDINSLTIAQLASLVSCLEGKNENVKFAQYDNGMIGRYVLVRCRDAGVHAGVLVSHNGRECVLTEARRLWYWKPANGQCFLSGVAIGGLDSTSKVGTPLPRLHLTEDCEIALCTPEAEKYIRAAKIYER
ncbi:hypothetical protein KGP36_07760 [Patescibacteria group bacterium]|nr:hypothetical protein [Patescibacteria group bacterium]